MELFVPGRICLFGEHSDWAGGYRRINPTIEKGQTLICGTEQGIAARVEAHSSILILRSVTPDGLVMGPVEFPMCREVLLEQAQKGGFWSYIAGVAYQALVRYGVGGLIIDNYCTNLPVKKGLSSSAAICVLTARAFNRCYELNLSREEEMELAYQGEVTTPSRCGRMDQGCAFDSRPILMTFDGDRIETKELEIGGEVHMVIVDLKAKKDTLKILHHLHACFPDSPDQIARGVRTLLGKHNQWITKQAVVALHSGDGKRLGELMIEAQTLFDRYAQPACPEELTAPRLHRLLDEPQLKPFTWGGKGIGSQGDGSAQLVAKSAADQQTVINLIQQEIGLCCQPLTIYPTS
jgi:galactokinase